MFSSRTFTYTWQGRGLKWNQNCLDLLTLCVLPFYLHHMKFIFCAGVHTHLKTQQNIWCFGGGKFQTENVNQRFGIHCTTWLHPSHTTTRNVLSVWQWHFVHCVVTASSIQGWTNCMKDTHHPQIQLMLQVIVVRIEDHFLSSFQHTPWWRD